MTAPTYLVSLVPIDSPKWAGSPPARRLARLIKSAARTYGLRAASIDRATAPPAAPAGAGGAGAGEGDAEHRPTRAKRTRRRAARPRPPRAAGVRGGGDGEAAAVAALAYLRAKGITGAQP